MKAIKKPTPKSEIEFPVLMESDVDNLVILFTSKYTGTVLASDVEFQLGEYSENWVSYTNPGWRPFQGTLELSNK